MTVELANDPERGKRIAGVVTYAVLMLIGAALLIYYFVVLPLGMKNSGVIFESMGYGALFAFPALFHGREVADIRLRFEGGAVVEAEASRGREYLDSLLEIDEGARRLGEVAFGLNYEIDRFTQNTLFDEKIGGTMHVALGAAFTDLGGLNNSGLHWDLVCDLREDGEVYADGELVWRSGHFLESAAAARV